jgi:hypothetical protein
MTRSEAQQFNEAAATQQGADDGDVPVSPLDFLKRLYHWLLDEIAPPANEPFDDWADRQW